MADDLKDLYNPVPVPTPLGESPPETKGRFTPQAQRMADDLINTTEETVKPVLPIGSGNTMYKGTDFEQEDIANVGGVKRKNKTPLPSTLIPEQKNTAAQNQEEFNKYYDDLAWWKKDLY